VKVLFDHHLPFALAHGGLQGQIEQTMAALNRLGVEAEPVRWWDEKQRGDIIHFFGRPDRTYIDLAHAKGMKVVVAELHSALGSRSGAARLAQKSIMRLAQAAMPQAFTAKLAWDAYQKADAFIANTTWESHIIQTMFDADPARIHVVTNGIEDVFFRPHVGGTHLVCTAAIHPRKRVLELAEAAAGAETPLWIVGRPYSDSDAYYRRFLEVQQANSRWIRYEGAIADREQLARIYSESRGFVLLSTQETLSFSALEAAAAGSPLLLADLPWARSAFSGEANYVSVALAGKPLGVELRKFYDAANSVPATFRPSPWDEVGARFAAVYREVLARPRD
jgi:glycosyltransferase involved in cell wall biosynthesis